MQIYEAVNTASPNLCDPARTAVWEILFDEVEKGKQTADDAIARILKSARQEIENIAKTNVRIDLGGDQKPSKKMADWAKRIAEQKDISLPRGALSSTSVLRAFLDEHAPKRSKTRRDKQSRAKASSNSPMVSPKPSAPRYPRRPLEAQNPFRRGSTPTRPQPTPPGRLPRSRWHSPTAIAEEKGLSIPDDVQASATRLSKWLDKQKGSNNRTGPSPGL